MIFTTLAKYNEGINFAFMFMRRLFILILIGLLSGVCANAQTFSNVRSTFSCSGEITVNYDLYMEGQTETTNVIVYYSTDNGQNYTLCTTVRGDLLDQNSGNGKSVIWDLKADGFSTGFFVFKVEPECVWINGVCWATRNVGEPGRFVDHPEDAGMFYQWNSAIGWSSTDPLVSFPNGNSWSGTWDGNSATTWETTNNICPAGFRMPTLTEYQSLLDAGSQWTTIKGVNGRKFGSYDNTIFLPAFGRRESCDGMLNPGWGGNYWSSTRNSIAYYLTFGVIGVEVTTTIDMALGFLCRCVAE